MTDYIDIAEILFTYSGGAVNSDPSASLGGAASAHQIQGSANNLFPDISEAQQEDGYIDYRCFYCRNTSSNNILYETTAWVTNVAEGATVQLGIDSRDDAQRIGIVGPITGGSFTASYEGTNFTANWDADSAVWAQNIETAMNALDELSGVVVTANPSGSDEVFNIEFGDPDGNRNHDLLTLVSNDLTPANAITFTKVYSGRPINTQADKIATATTVPNGVTFGDYTEASPLTVGTIKPGDNVPFWIKRTSPAGVDAMRDDGFSFRIVGKPF
jgi:hypothetical protein